MTFEEKLHEHAARLNALLQTLLAADGSPEAPPPRLADAMRYAVLDGGKRFRPFLVLESASLFDISYDEALYTAAAVECIHCYSLVHDDLPAMDDDALRRGRPTVHMAFDEATAILAGDGLQSLAFEILSDPKAHPDPQIRSRLCLKLAQASGWRGMAGGQDMDLQAATQTLGKEDIEKLQLLKTGALVGWSCEAGAILGDASEAETAALSTYARCLGLGFQIADDLLDLEGSEEMVGKQVGKDSSAGKATLVSHLGADQAKRLLVDLEAKAIASLELFGEKAATLIQAARFVTHREH